jgi:primosomal protein N'
MLIESNYKDFFINTLEERKLFKYPPFVEMATLEYRHKNKEKALEYIQKLEQKLKDLKKEEIEIILNSSPRKKYNQYHYKLILK